MFEVAYIWVFSRGSGMELASSRPNLFNIYPEPEPEFVDGVVEDLLYIFEI